ncbi:V-type ATP synthase subunit I (plasmid) [Carnobacterium maltaromaticum]|uniref:V-type ATP synthase subunit I n=1 Tax=Carnobacterium maltaromaticum TaxID=2751 RepID=UPI00344F2613
MAIAEMKKITLIGQHSEKEQIVKSAQELQHLELFNLTKLQDKENFIYDYKIDMTVDSQKEIESTLRLIEESYSFIQKFKLKKRGLSNYRKGRKHYEFNEIEKIIENSELLELCDELKIVEKELHHLDQLRKNKNNELDFFTRWKNLKFNPMVLQELNFLSILIGTISVENGMKLKLFLAEENDIYVEEIYQTRDEMGIVLYFDRLYSAQMERNTQSYHFAPIIYDYPSEPEVELEKCQMDIAMIIEKQAKLKNKVSEYINQAELLEIGIEYYVNFLEREKAKSLLMNGKHLFILNGWLESTKIEELRTLLSCDIGEESYALIAKEIMAIEVSEVPTVLTNNAIIEPFETLTEMYSMPKYDEVDPTPILMPFYMVFFGMMVADVGYGLLLLIVTFLIQRFFNLDRGILKNIRFFYLLSFPTILWGFVYGSFFGYALPFHVLDPQKDVNAILITSVVFGFIQLIFGLCVNGTVLWRKKQIKNGYVESFSWVGILCGIALIALELLVFPSSVVFLIGASLIGINVFGLLLFSTLGYKNKLVGFGSGLYSLYGITGYVGDLVSYTRLMALGIAGGSIAQAFNLIIDLLPPVAKFTVGIVLFALLHSINIFLSFLSAYVHGARLQYVEFFGKFYQGGGRSLKPLKTYEKYIYLKKREMKSK